MRRGGAGATTLLATVAGVLAVAAALVCRAPEVRAHDEAVFGHFSSRGAAVAYARKPRALGFRGIKIENDGCGDFEVEIDGADTQRQRTSFGAEAAKSHFQVTFEQRGEPLQPPANQVVGVFGSKTTVEAANALAWKLARIGFRLIDVVPSGRRWLVVMPQVPVRNALPIAKEVAKAGFHIQFRHGSK
jgi:hypothetical protein